MQKLADISMFESFGNSGTQVSCFNGFGDSVKQAVNTVRTKVSPYLSGMRKGDESWDGRSYRRNYGAVKGQVRSIMPTLRSAHRKYMNVVAQATEIERSLDAFAKSVKDCMDFGDSLHRFGESVDRFGVDTYWDVLYRIQRIYNKIAPLYKRYGAEHGTHSRYEVFGSATE